MRRHLGVGLVFSVFFGLAIGMSGAQDGKKEKKDAKTAKTLNYYPIEVGNSWTYRVTANGNKAQVVTRISKHETLSGEILARLDSPNVVMSEHLKQSDKGVYRFRFNGQEVNPPFQLMPYPAKIGAKWQGEFTVGKEAAKHKYFGEIQKEEMVEVPAGKFKTMRIQIKLEENGQQVETTYWFARDVGFVKQTFTVPGNSILLELEKFEQKK